MGYLPPSAQHDPSPEQQTLVVVILTNAGDLHMFLNPAWEKIVRPEDHDYFDELWADFAQRARVAPEALFEQLTSLSTGPIATSAVGAHLSDYPDLQELVENFVPIVLPSELP